MATPITWRNVNAPDLGTASDILARGTSAIDSGISGLQGQVKGVIDRREDDAVSGLRNTLLQATSASDVEGFDSLLADSGIKGKKATELLKLAKSTKEGLEKQAEKQAEGELLTGFSTDLINAESQEDIDATLARASKSGLSAKALLGFTKDAQTQEGVLQTRAKEARTKNANTLLNNFTDFTKSEGNLSRMQQAAQEYSNLTGAKIDPTTGLIKSSDNKLGRIQQEDFKQFLQSEGLPTTAGPSIADRRNALNDSLSKLGVDPKERIEFTSLFDQVVDQRANVGKFDKQQKQTQLDLAQTQVDQNERDISLWKERNPRVPLRNSEEWNKETSKVLDVAANLVDLDAFFGADGVSGTDIAGIKARSLIANTIGSEWALVSTPGQDKARVVDISKGTRGVVLPGETIDRRVTIRPAMVETALRSSVDNEEINQTKFRAAIEKLVGEDGSGDAIVELMRLKQAQERAKKIRDARQNQLNNPVQNSATILENAIKNF
jgi:hypothetical protein